MIQSHNWSLTKRSANLQVATEFTRLAMPYQAHNQALELAKNSYLNNEEVALLF